MTSIFFCFDETESGSVAPKALWTAAGSPMNAVPKSQQEESVLDVLTPDAELPASMAFCCKTGDEEGEAAPTARRLKQKSLRDEAFDLYRKCVATELRELELEGVVEADRLDELLVCRHEREFKGQQYGITNAGLDSNDSRGNGREHLAPLSSAVKFGATAVLRVLILFGADLRCKNGQSFRPLLLAAECDQQASFQVVAKALRARGELCDVAADKGNGYTVLHFAAINNNAGLLLSALEYEEYRDPLVIDARSSFETTGAESGGAGVDAAYVSNQTALHKAVLYDFRDCVVVLLEHGANPNVADNSGRTPLHSSVTRNNVPLTRALLDAGADPQSRDGNRQTLLEKDRHMDGRRTNKECMALIRATLAQPPKVRMGPAHHLNKAAKVGLDVDANKALKDVTGVDAVQAAPKLDTTELEAKVDEAADGAAGAPRRFGNFAGLFGRRSSSSPAPAPPSPAAAKKKKKKAKKSKSK
ncbi:hypothetical protein JL721_16 [Aureococcus anophagefferens]|nr:hypothetical protein JL721_16 [Aureococcus anophagefferens]